MRRSPADHAIRPSGSDSVTLERKSSVAAIPGLRHRRAWVGSLFTALGFMAALAAPVAGGGASLDSLAEVNDETITSKDLQQLLGARLITLDEQIYNLKRQGLEALIGQRLIAQEAAKRGMSVAQFVEAEIKAKAAPVTNEEIEAFYRANKARLRGDEAAVREQVRAHLSQQKAIAERARFLASVRAQAKILVHLTPPPVVRLTVSTDGAPSRGAADAPVTLVEFSDFHCPFCKSIQPTLTQLLERYPGKLRLVHRDFPVDKLHPSARRAAEAARCAQDQGKFWDYHDLLFKHAPRVAADDLRQFAKRADLDVATFERCLSDGARRSAVERDIEDGRRLGITGTPAFFVNGRPLVGGQPLEAFVRLIEEELSRQ
jgi:protein-disulfide isomerase